MIVYVVEIKEYDIEGRYYNETLFSGVYKSKNDAIEAVTKNFVKMPILKRHIEELNEDLCCYISEKNRSECEYRIFILETTFHQ